MDIKLVRRVMADILTKETQPQLQSQEHTLQEEDEVLDADMEDLQDRITDMKEYHTRPIEGKKTEENTLMMLGLNRRIICP